MTLTPVAVREEDKPEFILVRIERIISCLARGHIEPNNLVYMLTWLQWQSMIHFFKTHYHPQLKAPEDVAFIHYRGITMMPPRTPPV